MKTRVSAGGCVHTSRAIAIAAVLSVCGGALAQQTQPAPLLDEPVAVHVDSGQVAHQGEGEAVVFSSSVRVPGALSLRLVFDEVTLAGFATESTGAYLRLRSTLDGAEQRLNSRALSQWRNASAYFNGDEVTVEIVATGSTGPSSLRMSTVLAQFDPYDDRSICGSTDDRVLSYDNRAARLLPVGCTGWMIDDCARCFLTAGHCSTGSNSITVAEFNVPLSNSGGGLNHPPPEDQYAVDTTSRQSNNGLGVGNDYAYFGVFPNSNTGLTPYEAYGATYHLVTPPPKDTRNIRITGYGTTSPPAPLQWNQVQKTHAGPYFSFTGTTLSYQADTTGGNSGSPVIDDLTGFAIGIHTHGGCSGSSGNYGTGANHAGLQTYLATPKGICECLGLEFVLPNGTPELLDPAGGDAVRVEVYAQGGELPQPGTGLLHLDTGSGYIDIPMVEIVPNTYDAVFPAIPCGQIVSFYFSAETTSGEVVVYPSSAPAGTFSALAGLSRTVVVDQNFETDDGWTIVSENLTTGAWQRGIPVASAGAPGADYDGSGRCFLTGNFVGVDVDGGPTRLVSPIYDVAALDDPIVSFAMWFTNSNSDSDRLTIDVSNSLGFPWVPVMTVTPTGGWTEAGFRVRDYVEPTAQLQVRFSVADNPDNSTTEAAIDAFSIVGLDCGSCVADFNSDGTVNTIDVSAFLNAWAAGDSSADINADGTINTIDVSAFLNAWVTGC